MFATKIQKTKIFIVHDEIYLFCKLANSMFCNFVNYMLFVDFTIGG